MYITINPDKVIVEKIRAKLKANDGYCPCTLKRDADHKCMCKDFIENTPPGQKCHCGLYFKQIEE